MDFVRRHAYVTIKTNEALRLGDRTGRPSCAKNVVESIIAYRAQMSTS
jgi:hypothetical protein